MRMFMLFADAEMWQELRDEAKQRGDEPHNNGIIIPMGEVGFTILPLAKLTHDPDARKQMRIFVGEKPS